MRLSCLNWGHRGASGHALENTLVAFHKAVQMGADGIECDIRETRDGHLVVFHDPTLKRMAHRTEAIEQLSLAQIERVSLGHKTDQKKVRIPSLAHLLEEVSPPFLLNLEIKKATPQRLLDLIHRYPGTNRVLLSSFDPTLLIQVRALDSEIAIGYLVDRKVDAAIFKEARKMKARSLHLAAKEVSPQVIARAQGDGFSVYVYTVNTVRAMRGLMAMGVDGLFTNYPDRLEKLKTLYGNKGEGVV